jgi:hypothetical protein
MNLEELTFVNQQLAGMLKNGLHRRRSLRFSPLKGHGFVTAELVVAMGILAFALLPLSFDFLRERQLARAYYHRAIAMEIVDGEMEVLMAGEWRRFEPGSHPYMVRAESAKNLPAGKFVFKLEGNTLRLEWLPDRRGRGGRVLREAILK